MTEKEQWETPIPEVLFDALMDCTVSSVDKTITVQCGSYDSRDAVLAFLTGHPAKPAPR